MGYKRAFGQQSLRADANVICYGDAAFSSNGNVIKFKRIGKITFKMALLIWWYYEHLPCLDGLPLISTLTADKIMYRISVVMKLCRSVAGTALVSDRHNVTVFRILLFCFRGIMPVREKIMLDYTVIGKGGERTVTFVISVFEKQFKSVTVI